MHKNQPQIITVISICFFTLLNLGLATAQTINKFDSLYTTLYKQGNFNGCVLVAENGKPIYEKSFGYVDFNTKKLLTNQTLFELASVSKQFTAMAIMQLHQAHKLDYEDDIKKYFPQIPYSGITINNLLHHTSGIAEFLGWNEKQVDVNRVNYNEDILSSIIKNVPPLIFKPGEKFSYSNTNYVLLALIIEKTSKLSFKDYMNDFIFKPAGMTHTIIYGQRAAKKQLKNYAVGNIYDPVKGRFVDNDGITANIYQYYFDGIAGPYGISSTTEDMLKWDQVLYTDKLICKQEQEFAYLPAKLTDGSIASLTGIPYGFGWLLMGKSGFAGKQYLHTGGYPGYMTIIARYPDKNKVIIILTNIWNVVDMYQLRNETQNILFKMPFKIPQAKPFQNSVALNPAQLKAVEGTYSLIAAPSLKLNITTDAGQTYAQLTGQIRVEIYPESELNFFYTLVAAKIKFTKESDGTIKKLTLLQNGNELVATKE